MAYRHSEALTGVANALSEMAKTLWPMTGTPAQVEGAAEELKALARQVRELQGYWHNDENAAELGRHGKRVPLKDQHKLLLCGDGDGGTVGEAQMAEALDGLAIEGWEIIHTHCDLMGKPAWRVLLRRRVPA